MLRDANPDNTTVYAPVDEQNRATALAKVDLLAELAPEKAGKEWAFATILEPHATGDAIVHGRVLAREAPSYDTLRDLLPRDGALHPVQVRFCRTDGALVARPSMGIFAHLPEKEPTAFEQMQAQPQFQFMEMMKATNAHGLELMRFMMEDAREARKQANEARREEMRSLREMYAKTADTLGRIETARSQSPVEAVMEMPMAKAAASWVASKAGEFLADPAGFKEQVAGVAAQVAGVPVPDGSAAVEVIGPLLKQGMMFMAGQTQARVQEAKAKARIAEAEAEVKRAEMERDAAAKSGNAAGGSQASDEAKAPVG